MRDQGFEDVNNIILKLGFIHQPAGHEDEIFHCTLSGMVNCRLIMFPGFGSIAEPFQQFPEIEMGYGIVRLDFNGIAKTGFGSFRFWMHFANEMVFRF